VVKKTTIGQYLINEPLPEKYRDYTRIMNSSNIKKILNKIGTEEAPTVFRDVISTWSALGANYVYVTGHTISITDFAKPKDYRDSY
jgi:hypothetical protein